MAWRLRMQANICRHIICKRVDMMLPTRAVQREGAVIGPLSAMRPDLERETSIAKKLHRRTKYSCEYLSAGMARGISLTHMYCAEHPLHAFDIKKGVTSSDHSHIAGADDDCSVARVPGDAFNIHGMEVVLITQATCRVAQESLLQASNHRKHAGSLTPPCTRR